jgi:phenylacetate-CoA ligase
MNILKKIYNRWKRDKAIKILTTSSPSAIAQFGEKQLIPAFKRATKMPAYKKLLERKGIKYNDIKTIEDFKKNVPYVSKNDLFKDFDIADLCVEGNLDAMKLAMSSSGFSGSFAFGINTKYNQETIAFSIDTALEYVFKTNKRKTFLISCIPMGVKVPTELPIAETSIRSDMALAIIKKFYRHFEQIIIVGDPYFVKKLIEEGIDTGVDWKKMHVNLIFGEDWFSESFRLYIASLLGVDFDNPDKGLIGATMGIAELDLNIFHETIETIRLRQHAQENPKLMNALFGEDLKICPTIFQYYPHRMVLETNESNELIFTMLSKHFLIPLIRYNSNDRGYIIPYEKAKEILIDFNLNHLIPELKLPLVGVGGRNNRWLTVGDKNITPEEIKQGLYSDFEAAGLTTGYFKLNKIGDAGRIELQLKKGVTKSSDLQRQFKKALLKYCDADLEVVLYEYQTFPYAMELDYEKKFHPI